MSATREEFFSTAASLKELRKPLRDILEQLRVNGASSVDLIRVVKRIENVRVGDAVRLIEGSGLPNFDASLTFVIPEGDPLHTEILRPEGGAGERER
jgi:hypothetical protein